MKNNQIIVTDKLRLPPTKVGINDLLNSFLSGRKKTTIRAYHQDLTDFAEYVGARDLNEATNILLAKNPGEANLLTLQYKTHLFEQNLTPATINRRLATLRSLVKLARTLGLVTWRLEVENVKSRPYRDTKGPGLFGYRNILDVAKSRNDMKGIRDIAILRLLYDLALRRGEVAALNVNDVNLQNSQVTILGKGRTETETMTLPVATREALAAWLEIRSQESGPLFTNLDRARKGDGRLTGTAIYCLVRSYGKKVDPNSTVRPHGLRHTAITEALRLTNGNYQMAQRFSRHADVRVLKFYDDNVEDLGGKVAQMVSAVV